jgi:sigma-B regulation protein RsbU (phosphoserine phosphatase)
LPQTFPPFPERTEFEIYAQMVPAKEVGGDFYDFFMIDEARLGFVIGDVSGKGVPAALFMAVSRTLLKSTALTGHAPHQCLEQVNRLLRAENDSQMFVSLFYGILDTRTGEVTYSIGGHDPAYWLRPQRPIERVAGTGGIVLGLTEEVPYESQRVVLRPGEALFLYTDGVTDATDGEGRQFSHHRLEACLERVRWSSVTEMIPEVVRAAKDFGGGTQTDDITVLAVRYLGTG